MYIGPLRTHIRCSISVLPQTWWSPAVGWMKASLQQPIFCSIECTNCLMIQQNEKSTQNFPSYNVERMSLIINTWIAISLFLSMQVYLYSLFPVSKSILSLCCHLAHKSIFVMWVFIYASVSAIDSVDRFMSPHCLPMFLFCRLVTTFCTCMNICHLHKQFYHSFCYFLIYHSIQFIQFPAHPGRLYYHNVLLCSIIIS